MPKAKIERSEAILRKKRNTQRGLQIRNKILKLLYNEKEKKFSTNEIMDSVGISYASINYHLKNMYKEAVVEKFVIERKNYWKITGFGQQTIRNYLELTQ